MEHSLPMSTKFIVVFILALSLSSVGCENAATRYEKHLAHGRDELTKGGLQEAILSFKSALAARPGDAEVRKLLVECYLERGAKEPARQLLDPLMSERRDDPALPILDARVSLLEGNPDHALEILTGFMDVHGETADALTVLGAAHAAKKLWSEALDCYDRAVSKAPDDARAWFGKASVLATLKRNDEAAEAADRAIQADPHLGAAYLLRANLAYLANDLEGARSAQAVAQDRRVSLQARFGLGQVLLAQQKPKEALKEGQYLVKDYPPLPQGYYVCGVSHYLLGDYDEAASDLQTCLSKAPNHAGAEVYLALAQYRRGQWQQALGSAMALQAQYPGVKQVEMLIADLLLRTGDSAGAAKQAQRVLEAAPDSSMMYRVLGLARIQSGDAKGGAEALEEAQRLAPNERLAFVLGDVYLSMDALDKASSIFEAAAASDPTNAAAEVRLFYTRLRQKDYAGALSIVDTAMRETPDDPMWLNLRGAALFAKNDLGGAEAVWQQVVASHPDLPSAHLNLGGLYLKQQKWQAARKEYEAVLSVNPAHPIALTKLAALDVRDGNPSSAIDHLRSALAAQPEGRTALELSALEFQAGQIADADAAAKKATELAPSSSAAWIQAGVTSVALGDLRQGEADLRKATELDSTSALAWFHLAGIEARRKDWAKAREDLKKAAAIAPNDVGITVRRVRVELAAGRNATADRIAGNFLRDHGDQPAAYRLSADVAETLGRIDDARRLLASAQEKFGETPAILLLQAGLERRHGNLEKASSYYDRVLQIDPKSAQVMLRKALVQTSEGHFEEAAKAYESVLGLTPNNPVALNDLAYIYSDVLDRPKDALALLKRVDPKVIANVPTVRDTLGWAQLKTGDVASAVQTLREVVQGHPEIASARYHLGVALVAAGRTEEARRELQAAIDLGLSAAEKEAARKLLGESQ